MYRVGKSENVSGEAYHFSCLFPPSSLAPLLPHSLTQSLGAFKLVLRAGVPRRAVNLLSRSLSRSPGLIALSHHGLIMLEGMCIKKVECVQKRRGLSRT